MSDSAVPKAEPESELRRSITGRLLFFYVLGDVLGSGIYVLIGAVAGEVGGAFWAAFAVGVTVAAFTGLAYAELATKYPRAAGASLYVNKAFGSRALTFLTTVLYLSATFAAAGSLAAGFARYFGQIWSLPPALLIMIVFIILLAIVNYVGITESVVINMAMTIVEVTGLVIVLLIGAIYVGQGKADFTVLTNFSSGDNVVFAIIAGVALAFFAMTGFENAANVAEETIDPSRNFPRALIGGMAAAGVIYVLVSMSAALVVPVDTLASSDAALLEVIRAGILPISVSVMVLVFAIIAMVAITNTTLVQVVTQSRILYGMAREDVVPAAFAKVHPTRRSPVVALVFSAVVVIALLVAGDLLNRIGLQVDIVERLAAVTVVLLLVVYAGVIVACLKLRGSDETSDTFRAPTALLLVGLVGNVVLLYYVISTDPGSLIWCAGLVAVGFVLFVAELALGKRDRPAGVRRGEPIDGKKDH
ncbi:APC family permease [Nocardioides sp. CFH 31398]|uniref:APC family permease n=1 Tax=Nocardioides sp. CFH 31398 TaxID=2919579 RepID=UPI001F051FCB|nr:APC family permease [Nocardioides sp. CFH 31398]MCH1866277.1 APC family permease [Nocardioides sp. CFH 31398]